MPFFETQCVEFFFVIIGYIINIFLLFLFNVSFSSGIIYCYVFVFDELGVFVHRR